MRAVDPIGDVRGPGERLETVRASAGHVQRNLLIVAELETLPVPVRGGTGAQVDDDVEDRSIGAADQLRLAVTAAYVQTADHAGGTVRTSLLPSSGHSPPGRRASLVDAVMDLPEVQASSRLEATLPLGDAESLERLRERTEDTVSRPAGSTTLVDADIPPAESG